MSGIIAAAATAVALFLCVVNEGDRGVGSFGVEVVVVVVPVVGADVMVSFVNTSVAEEDDVAIVPFIDVTSCCSSFATPSDHSATDESDRRFSALRMTVVSMEFSAKERGRLVLYAIPSRPFPLVVVEAFGIRSDTNVPFKCNTNNVTRDTNMNNTLKTLVADATRSLARASRVVKCLKELSFILFFYRTDSYSCRTLLCVRAFGRTVQTL